MFKSLFPTSFATRLSQIWSLGCRGSIADALEASVALQSEAQTAGDREAEGCGALQASWFAFQIGSVERGLDHATTAKGIFQSLGCTTGESAAVAMGAWLMLEGGMMEEAAADAERALRLAESTGDPGVLGFVTSALGVVLWYSGQADVAVTLCAEAVRLADHASDPVASAWWRINLAGAHAAIGGRHAGHGDVEGVPAILEDAIRINATAFDLASKTGDFWCQALALCNGAEFLCAAGRIDEALAQLAICATLQWLPTERSRAHFITTQAEALLLQGRPMEALALCEEALLRDAALLANLETKILLFKHMADAHERTGAFQHALEAFKQFHAAHQRLSVEKAQRHARIAGIRYETHRLRAQAEAAQAEVASLVLTTQSDPLTGLANRRVFDLALADLVRHPRPYALAIIDLDHFKRINDRFSHPVGDAVLSQIGAILTACCPLGDLVARIGGEEFMLLVIGSDPEAASRLCTDVCQTIATFPWSQHHAHLVVTTSIGLARFDEVDSPQNALALADRRLYEAKARGRNCVVDRDDPRHPTRHAEVATPSLPGARRASRRSAATH